MRHWIERHSSGFAVAVGSFLWGCLSLALSILSGAACLKVVWKAGGASFEMVYGYAVELNAGLWYVIGASLSFLGAFGLLHAAYSGLANSAVLTTTGVLEEASPLARIAAVNKRYFTYLLPLVMVRAVSLVLIPEIVFRDKNASRLGRGRHGA